MKIETRLRGKRIFLTGGTGFFGKTLLETLPPEAEATVLSRHPEQFRRRWPQFARFRMVAGDIRDFAFPSERFDLIVHAATDAVLGMDDDRMTEVIVGGTRRLLAFAERCGAERILLTGSGAVYGIQPPELERLPETFPCRPTTAYGRGKLAAEELAAASGLPVIPARCFAFVGPYLNLDIHFAVGNFIRDCLAGRPIEIRGDGTPRRSYLDAADLAHWLWTLLLDGTPGRPYNVGSDRAVSIVELAEAVRRAAGTDNPIAVRTPARPGIPPPRYVPAIDRARRELGLEVRIELEEALHRTIDWHRRHPSPPAGNCGKD